MAKITKLTTEQETELARFRLEVFHKVTTPGIDPERAEKAIIAAYAAIDQPPPEVVCVQSPVVAQKVLRERGIKKGKSFLLPSVYPGAWWAAWNAYYTFCGTLPLDVPYSEGAKRKLAVSSELSYSCGWLWVYEGLAIVSEKPKVFWTDDRWDPAAPVIHNAEGPAVAFADGFELYAWRGTVVPKEWIANEPPVTAALTYENLEQRRAAAEILGWSVVLDKLNPEVIDEDDPEIGTLVEVDLPDSGRQRFLRVRCGTGREFALCVPNEMATALQANAWTYDMKPEEFAPEIRT